MSGFYTGKGDDGTSALFGGGNRLPKDSSVFEFLGSLDELNSWLGVCKAWLRQSESADTKLLSDMLSQSQEYLFIIQAQAAGADQRLSPGSLKQLESAIATLASSLEPAHSFVVPGASLQSSILDVGRTVVRRCERDCIRSTAEQPLPDQAAVVAYLNRLSSLLYVMARFINRRRSIEETAPSYDEA